MSKLTYAQAMLLRNVQDLAYRRFEKVNEAHCSVVSIHQFSVHGVEHWRQVSNNAVTLANIYEQSDKLVALLFAALHDCCRENDGEDPQHGERAADWVKQEIAPMLREGGLTDLQLDELDTAIREHNKGKCALNTTVAICWDADRLDLDRPGVGKVIDITLLSTPAAKLVADKRWEREVIEDQFRL
jgi:uncharacterized protein